MCQFKHYDVDTTSKVYYMPHRPFQLTTELMHELQNIAVFIFSWMSEGSVLFLVDKHLNWIQQR